MGTAGIGRPPEHHLHFPAPVQRQRRNSPSQINPISLRKRGRKSKFDRNL
jgi:hypothetical protein